MGGCVIVCKTAFNATLFKWDGFSGDDTLFSTSGDRAVGDLYSDLPEYGYHTKSSAKILFSKDDSSGMPGACHDLYTTLGKGMPT